MSLQWNWLFVTLHLWTVCEYIYIKYKFLWLILIHIWLPHPNLSPKPLLWNLPSVTLQVFIICQYLNVNICPKLIYVWLIFSVCYTIVVKCKIMHPFSYLCLTVTCYLHIAYLYYIWMFPNFNELNVICCYLHVIRDGSFARLLATRRSYVIYPSEWNVQVSWIGWAYYFKTGA